MPRPARANESVSVISVDTHNRKTPAGHTITVYADFAVYDETAGKFINWEDTIRKQ